MNLPEDCTLTYVMRHQSWYYDDIKRADDLPTLGVVASHPEGGCAWEFNVVEHQLSREPSAQIQMFYDAFAAFEQIPGFFAAMAELKPKTLDGVRLILDGMGAKDDTDREMPAEMRKAQAGRLRRRADELDPPSPAPQRTEQED